MVPDVRLVMRNRQGVRVITSREWHLTRRPTAEPTPADVTLREVELGAPGPGEVLVRNLAVSVEPYMWGRMTGTTTSYAEPFALDAPMTGHAVGRIEMGDPSVPAGALVLHEYGWREAAIVPVGRLRVLPEVDGIAPSAWLGALGLTGFTAYAGLIEVARVRPGETVWVSAAAGAVGSVAVQIARALGATVIGSAGVDDKVSLVRELGARSAFSHRGGVREGLAASLAEVGASGLDVYFDNVGGRHLEAAVRHLNPRGRVALCGAIATYGSDPDPGPRNLLRVIWQRARLEGFLVDDHAAVRPAFEAAMTGWLTRGEVRSVESASDGIDSAFAAFTGMLAGSGAGKAVVRLAGA